MDPKELEITEKLKMLRDISKEVYAYLSAEDMYVGMIKADTNNLLRRKQDIVKEIEILEGEKKAIAEQGDRIIADAKVKADGIIKEAEEKMVAVVKAREEARGLVEKAKEESRNIVSNFKNRMKL